jgi:ATP-binding cassette subfamily B protein
VSAPARRDDDDEDELEQRPLDWGIIKRLVRYTRPHARTRTLLLVLVVLRSIQYPLLGWAVAAILSGPIARHDPGGIRAGVLGFFALALFTEVTFHFRIRLALEFGEAVVHDLREDLYRHLLRMPVSYFNARTGRVGRIISRMVSDVDAIRVGVQDCVFIGVVQAGTMIVAGALMIHYDPLLFLVVLALVPVLWKLLDHFRKKLSRAHRVVHESMSRVTSSLAESVTGVRVTQGYVREDINGGLFRQLIDAHSRNNMQVVRHQAVFLPMLEFNGQLFIAILLAVGGAQALAHEVEIPALVQFLFLANLFFNPIPILGNMYNQALTSMAGAERVFRLLDTEPAWRDPPDARPLPRIEGRVELRGVAFSYDGERKVLSDVDLVALPGQTIALVGPTGGGKSTIVGLLAKFYLPTEGAVLVDGHDLREVAGDSLRKQLGYVLQSNFLFSGTVLDNVRLGRPDATLEDVVAAARALDVLDLVEDLPEGWQTRVGEKGGSLSLGQRQIVCFLRAWLVDPRVVLLDEATSAVDSLTEARLQRALDALLRGRTAFIVAHRLSTIRHADQVLVVERGRIVERGTHRELLGRGGRYADLHRAFVRAARSAPADPEGPRG